MEIEKSKSNDDGGVDGHAKADSNVLCKEGVKKRERLAEDGRPNSPCYQVGIESDPSSSNDQPDDCREEFERLFRTLPFLDWDAQLARNENGKYKEYNAALPWIFWKAALNRKPEQESEPPVELPIKLRAWNRYCANPDFVAMSKRAFSEAINAYEAERQLEREVGSGWQPIRNAPKDRVFLGVIEYAPGQFGEPFIAHWDEGMFCCKYFTEAAPHKPTHWAELPEIPRRGSE